MAGLPAANIKRKTSGGKSCSCSQRGHSLAHIKQEASIPAKKMNKWWGRASPIESKVVKASGLRVSAGRGPYVELFVDDRKVSRMHSLLTWDNNYWWMIDLNSKNGTFIHQRRIEVAQLSTQIYFA